MLIARRDSIFAQRSENKQLPVLYPAYRATLLCLGDIKEN